jgi:HSP20 family protein
MVTKKNLFQNKIADLQQADTESAEDFFQQVQLMGSQPMSMSQDSTANVQRTSSEEEVWIDTTSDGYEGQLAVDIFQDQKNLYIKAIIGGIRAEDIELHLNNDMLTVKGKRIPPDPSITAEQYYIQECYWGGFSRSIILPVDVVNDRVEAHMENGVLLIILPKSKRPRNTRIPIKIK